MMAALAELYRAVRPGGLGLIWDVDWSTVSWHSSDGAHEQTADQRPDPVDVLPSSLDICPAQDW
jgi:hypothetical protein